MSTLRTFMPLAAALICASAIPALAGDAKPLLVATVPGSSIAYKIDFSGSFWNGQPLVFSRTAVITVAQNEAVHVVTSGPQKSDNVTANGSMSPDGTIAAPGAASYVGSYNTIAGALANAPASLPAGASWSGTVPLQTGSDGSTSALPVTMTVKSVDGKTTIIQGVGASQISTTYAGYPVPIDARVAFAIRLTNGAFDRCDFSASELVHAGPETQTMHWKWSATRTAAGGQAE